MVVLLTLLVAFLLTAVVTWLLPSVLRSVWWALLKLVYRFRIYHAARVPSSGPALLVCNHVSYIDWMIVWAACPRRVRFVLWSGYYRNPILRFFLSWVRNRTIRIDNRTARPHAIAASLQTIADALTAGEVVLVFAEGRLTRNGQMLPFGRGIEQILQRTQIAVPVVPISTNGLWGSIFSHKDGPILRKWPGGLRRSVSVWFGEPLRGNPSAPEVRAAVAEGFADLAIAESGDLPSVVAVFVRTAMRWPNKFRTAFIDVATGTERRFSFSQSLVGTWCLANWIRRRIPGEEPIGIWLPTGLGSAFTNIAIGYLDRPTVNLNYTAGRASVDAAIQQAGIRVVITSKRFVERVPLVLPPGVERIDLEDALASIGKLAKLVRMVAVVVLPSWCVLRLIGAPRTATDGVQTIVFSSGSTGEPKA